MADQIKLIVSYHQNFGTADEFAFYDDRVIPEMAVVAQFDSENVISLDTAPEAIALTCFVPALQFALEEIKTKSDRKIIRKILDPSTRADLERRSFQIEEYVRAWVFLNVYNQNIFSKGKGSSPKFIGDRIGLSEGDVEIVLRRYPDYFYREALPGFKPTYRAKQAIQFYYGHDHIKLSWMFGRISPSGKLVFGSGPEDEPDNTGAGRNTFYGE